LDVAFAAAGYGPESVPVARLHDIVEDSAVTAAARHSAQR
jgi:hypothetical protein